MAKGKRKRGGDAKLRVIAGGAAPKAVVTKRAPASSSPSIESPRAKAAPPNLRREVAQKRIEPENDVADSAPDVRASAVAKVRKSPFPRALILGGLVVALGGAAYALTRNSMEPKPATPAIAPAPTEWPSSAPVAASAVASEAVVAPSASVTASVSAPAPASVSASAPASVSAPATATATAPVTATATASAAPAPPKPPPAKPKPADDDPYQ